MIAALKAEGSAPEVGVFYGIGHRRTNPVNDRAQAGSMSTSRSDEFEGTKLMRKLDANVRIISFYLSDLVTSEAASS